MNCVAFGDETRHFPKKLLRAIVSTGDLNLSESRSKGMNSGNQDKAEGTGKKAMGSVKEKVGGAIGNPDLRDRGTAEKVEGKVQDKVGDVKKVFEK